MPPNEPTYAQLWKLHKELWLEFIGLSPEDKKGAKGQEIALRMQIVYEEMIKKQ